jgi:CHAT domain-containing protein
VSAAESRVLAKTFRRVLGLAIPGSPLEGQEGISTLSRAFLLAGARTVVSTLWSVQDDSTLFLMKSFYDELTRNKRAPDALSAAKRVMLKKYGAAKAVPFYWAGFTIEGAAEPPTTH